MAIERVRRLIEAALREAAGPEHERLKADLNEWAAAQGYPEVLRSLPSGRIPDVLRYDSELRHLFVGDAKDADVETTSDSATVQRIAGYVREFGHLLGGTQVDGGIVAIATNDAAEAEKWVLALNLFCVMSSITAGDDSGADFHVIKLENKNTWIVWW
jgi:hypothetical protein